MWKEELEVYLSQEPVMSHEENPRRIADLKDGDRVHAVADVRRSS